MTEHEPLYRDIAARDHGRIAALSDGLFAIAMTLIVLEIRVPHPGEIATDAQLWAALTDLAPRFLTYVMSFLTLGIFWNGQQAELNHLARLDTNLAWIHLAYLAVVALLPFTTSLLAEYITFRLALLLYWANIVALGVGLYAGMVYAKRANLLKAGPEADPMRPLQRRIIVFQALYLIGALLCIINTYWSIAFIFAVQLIAAFGPATPLFRRL